MSIKTTDRDKAPRELLELFFSIHYTIGMTIEDTLRNEILTRQQTIIMWLIRSKGEDGKTMRRKDIVKSMSYWFELTNSAISKALRSLAKDPHNFLLIQEDPNSGREKVISLTPKGEKFIHQMTDKAEALIKILTDEMSDKEFNQGINFFKVVSRIFDTEIEQKRDKAGFNIAKPSVKRRV